MVFMSLSSVLNIESQCRFAGEWFIPHREAVNDRVIE